MNQGADAMLVTRLAPAQRGVFSKADLQTALGEAHPSAFVRRVSALESLGVVRRFLRGWYVAESFDLSTLSQRIAPESYVSFETVLAERLVVGAASPHRLRAVKLGKARTYAAFDVEIEHVSIAEHLYFGFAVRYGVRYADAEKATLDALYFHLRGMRYTFDVFSDLAIERLDARRLERYLARYRNPKFVAFARDILELGR
ncbi:MAG: hypothetical protein RIT81_32480 [Deltaproteobacteria bacterium]